MRGKEWPKSTGHLKFLPIGYLLTWVTYGAWLQGDERGYVKDGEIAGSNAFLRKDNESRLVKEELRFGVKEKRIVQSAIIKESIKYDMSLRASAVCSNHVHVVLGYSDFEIGNVVRQLKQAGKLAMKEKGMAGKVWAKGYDKRFCFDEESFQKRIDYVARHK